METAGSKYQSTIDQVEALCADRSNIQAVNKLLNDLISQDAEALKDVEIVWRLSRSHWETGGERPDDKEWRKEHSYKALEYAKAAMALDPNHYASHKWMASSISATGDFVTTKEKIGNSYSIKEHALKANELKPKDPSTLHMLGRWCFAIANVGWMERKIASALFATPPTSTFEEALAYFQEADALAPNFMLNVEWLGSTLMQLKRNDEAKAAFERVLALPAAAEQDKVLQAECKKKLAKL